HAGLEVFLVFLQVDKAVVIGIPDVALVEECLGHFVGVEEAVAILVHALEEHFRHLVRIRLPTGAVAGAGHAAGALWSPLPPTRAAHAILHHGSELLPGYLSIRDTHSLGHAIEHGSLHGVGNVRPVDDILAAREHVEELVGVAAHHAAAHATAAHA